MYIILLLNLHIGDTGRSADRREPINFIPHKIKKDYLASVGVEPTTSRLPRKKLPVYKNSHDQQSPDLLQQRAHTLIRPNPLI